MYLKQQPVHWVAAARTSTSMQQLRSKRAYCATAAATCVGQRGATEACSLSSETSYRPGFSRARVLHRVLHMMALAVPQPEAARQLDTFTLPQQGHHGVSG
jgi:hypothetical protein